MQDAAIDLLSTGSVLPAALQRVFRRRAPALYALLSIAFGAASQGGGTIQTVTGVSPLALVNALAKPLRSLIQYGKCVTENGDIYCNNGVLRMVDDELPAGHTRLQYIESDGTSGSGGYVDTGIVLNTIDLDVEVDFQFADTTSSSPKMAWGYMASGNLPRWGFGIYSSKWLGSPNVTASAGTIDTNRHTAVMSVFEDDGEKYGGTVDGEALYSATTLGNVAAFKDNTLPFYLFTRNNNGVAGNFAPVKIFGFKVYKADVLTHDLVPCKNDLGVIGFYDLKTSTFLAGTGALTAGPADYSHAHVGVVGTEEVLTVSAVSPVMSDNIVNNYGLSSSDGARVSNAARCYTYIGYYPAGTTITVRAKATSVLGSYLYTYNSDGTPSASTFINAQSMTAETEIGDGWYERTATSTRDGYLFIQALVNKSSALAADWSATQPRQTASVVNLFQVGEVKDEINLITGVVTRRTEPVYENGAIVIKALATPVTEQTTPHELRSYAGDTTVSWTAAVSGTVKTVEYAQGETAPNTVGTAKVGTAKVA